MKRTHCLIQLKRLLDSHQIFFWIDFGILLGAIREKNFIAYDDDIDISLWAEDYWKIRKILELTKCWKYKAIWRRELSIYHEEYPDLHIDLFFYEKTEQSLNFYVYLKNSRTDEVSVESQVQLPPHITDSFTEIEFLENKFNIPQKYDEYLTAQYGDWRTPTQNWYYSKRNYINHDYCAIAIIIPTFLRDDKLINCIKSIQANYMNVCRNYRYVRIYVGDQNNQISEQKQELIYALQQAGHQYFQLPFNCGLSYARNYLLKQTTEPYIIIADDDYEFTNLTKFEPFMQILLQEENLGIVGGKLNDRKTKPIEIVLHQKNDTSRQIYYIIKNNPLISTQSALRQSNYSFFKTEMVSNFFMMKRDVFKDIQWDEELKLVEHTDYFLRLKTTKWKVAFTPDSVVNHCPGKKSLQYFNFRDANEGLNCKTSLPKFQQKWQIESHQNQKLVETPIFNIYIPKQKYNVVQLCRIPCANSGYELNQLINQYSSEFQSRYVLGNHYSGKLANIPARPMPVDLFWQTQREECLNILSKADIVHVHHDTINDISILEILKKKKVITTFYNLSNSLQYAINEFNLRYIQKCKELSNILTVADQPLQRKFFSDITTITVPLVKMLFNQEQSCTNSPLKIIFAPTNKEAEGVASKKYYDVLSIINELKKEHYDFQFELIEGCEYYENLRKKSSADIIIDDVDPAYEKSHNTSIEAACFGAIPLTNYTGEDYPFYKTNLNSLKETLIKFINSPHLVEEEKQKIISWRRQNYTPEKLLSVYERLYYELINELTFRKSLIVPEVIETTTAKTIEPPSKTDLYDFFKTIKQQQIESWLLGITCYEVLKHKTVISDIIYLGVSTSTDKEKINALANQFNLSVKITVEPHQKTKVWKIFDIETFVPCPVKQYLEKIMNKKWEELDVP